MYVRASPWPLMIRPYRLGVSSSSLSACAESERQNGESQYQGDYEASLNPWGDWKERERASRRTRLGLVDRVMYEFGQIVYGSPCAHSPERLVQRAWIVHLHRACIVVLNAPLTSVMW